MSQSQEAAIEMIADRKSPNRRFGPAAGGSRASESAMRSDSNLFMLPSAVILGAVMIAPLLFALYLSFFNYFIGQEKSFVGLANYGMLLTEARFWKSLATTLYIVFASVGLEFCSGLLIAYGLYNLSAGERFFNVLIMLPNIITPVVAGVFLRWVFVPDWGMIDVTLRTIHLGGGPDFLGNPVWARLMVIFADMWQNTPFMVLVLFAGLNSVDKSQIEAAQIDGVGPFRMLTRIMVPNIKPLIVFVLAIRLMDAFRFFDQIFILTAGGPGTATETLTMYTYALGFNLLNIGAASALGAMTLMIELVVVLLMIRIVYRKEKGAF